MHHTPRPELYILLSRQVELSRRGVYYRVSEMQMRFKHAKKSLEWVLELASAPKKGTMSYQRHRVTNYHKVFFANHSLISPQRRLQTKVSLN